MEVKVVSLHGHSVSHGVVPLIQTYEAAATANISRKRMNRNVSKLLAVTLFTLNSIVRRRWP